jgi:opacity protein-like surface antigen
MKNLFFVTLSICFVTVAQAQVKIGLRGAPQLTWSNTDNKSTFTNGTRVNAAYGLMLDYYFTDNYGIGTEFCINSYGTNLNLNKDKFTSITHGNNSYVSTESLKYDYRLRYIQVPVMLKMRTKEIGYLRYYAEFGFAAGILISSKADVNMARFSLDNVNINNPDEEDKFQIETTRYSDKVKSLKASMLVGVGVQYNIFGNSLLVAGLRYNNGLTSFTDDDRWKTSLNDIALNIGILF